jgi:hypothetical protein
MAHSLETSVVAWLTVIESSGWNLGAEGATTQALQHNHRVVASLLIEVQVEQPQLLLPLLTSDNRIERFSLATDRVKTINRNAYAFGIVSSKCN